MNYEYMMLLKNFPTIYYIIDLEKITHPTSLQNYCVNAMSGQPNDVVTSLLANSSSYVNTIGTRVYSNLRLHIQTYDEFFLYPISMWWVVIVDFTDYIELLLNSFQLTIHGTFNQKA